MNESAVLPILLVAVILWEIFFPREREVGVVSARHFGNIALLPFGIIISALMKPELLALFPLMYVDIGGGLLSLFGVYPLLYFILAFVLLDLSMYLQHRLLHANRFFWSLHSLHHSDTAVDFTTYFRHHPLETLVSAVMTLAVALLLGVTPTMLAVYLLVNNAMQLFQHSNIRLPTRLQWIERFFVTPAFHVEHHRIERTIADTNFSTVFTIWDRLFGTYSESNAAPKQFGVSGFEDMLSQSIGRMLLMPFLVNAKKK